MRKSRARHAQSSVSIENEQLPAKPVRKSSARRAKNGTPTKPSRKKHLRRGTESEA